MDSKYIDVKFDEQPEYTYGCIEATGFKGGAPFLDDSMDLIPENMWETIYQQNKAANATAANLITRVFNQKQEGSCTGNSVTQGAECLQALQVGRENVVHLSPISIYKQTGSSAQSGASVEDTLDAAVNIGILPLDNPENRAKFGDKVMPHTGFRTPYPADWKPVAANFQLLEYFKIQTLQQMMTAMLRPDMVVVVGREGHSILYVQLNLSSGNWLADYVNSWDVWGDPIGLMKYGGGHDTMNQMKISSQFAFAMRAMRLQS